jgi:hypothetical protein
MKSFEEIKYHFENKSYDIRSDFINEYHFKDDYYNYYKEFILNSQKIKNHLYLSDLIDLSSYLGIYDIKLRNRLFSYLLSNSHYIVKLAVLDYFIKCKKNLLVPRYENELNKLLNSERKAIVRNQILINLISLNSEKQNLYFQNLCNSIIRTEDWRSIYRIINSFLEFKDLKKFKADLYVLIYDLNKKKNFGEGVTKLLNELKQKIL